ncbi:MAG: PASTA domain-containing protein, partial [Actinomycetota bacterium]|nr:PASTA domain-containing protein [Actinomycetota bacterium]
EPVCILKITDSKGNILYEYDPQTNTSTKKVLEEPQAFLATQILQRVINEGTGKAANIGRPAAGKTGTTSDFRDAWFAGYSPELTTVVWMGYQDSNKSMEPINKRYVTGGSFPAQIWSEYMKEALKEKPVKQFEVPDNVLTEVQVCKESGMLPTYWCGAENIEVKLFVKGMSPTKYCNIHNKVTIPDLTGLPADEAKQILQELFFNISEVAEPNNEYASGSIFRTDPPPGTVIETVDNINPQITIFISQGRNIIKMPNLIGQTISSAESILSGFGLSVSNMLYDFSNQPIDIIYNQDPAPDTELESGTQIIIYVSKGVNPSSVMPNVIGINRNDAVIALNNAGFTNIIFLEDQSNILQDMVFNQYPAAGVIYDKSQPVTISISKGVKVPSVIGFNKDNAVKLLTSAGFVVEIVPSLDEKGTVVSQNPDANTYVNYGSKITITIETKQTTTSTTTSTTSPPDTSTSTSTTSSTPTTSAP